MSWMDALLGRTKPVKSSLDQLFGLSTADITLQTELDLKPSGAAAISFRPVSSGDFAHLQADIDALLKTSTKDAPLDWKSFADNYGYQWIIFKTPDFSNLVATVHMVSRELQDSGYGEQLLASIFQFHTAENRSVYWVYNYKRGVFYPFVPSPNGNQQRDNATEVRLSGVMKRELHLETDLTKWYPVWGVPLD